MALAYIDPGSVRVWREGLQAALEGRRDAILGRCTITITPDDGRGDGGSNVAIIGYLSRAQPRLVDLRGGDVSSAVNAAVRAVWKPGTSTLEGLGVVAGKAMARVLAARLRNGTHVTNTTETLASKARRGRGSTPGIDSGDLADGLENATVRVEK